MVRGFRTGVGAALVAAAFALIPASAVAKDAITFYPPDPDSARFSAGPGTYTAADESDGLCIAPLTCPSVTNEWVATGGTQNEGYLSSSIFGIAEAAGETRAIWTSAPFQYRGADGQRPTRLAFVAAHRSDLSSLLSAAGSEADYTIELVRDGVGVATPLVQDASLEPTQGWVNTGIIELPRDLLVQGANYSFRIVSRFVYGVDALGSGSADYDDVILVAVREEDDGDGNGGGGGNGDNKPGGGSAIFDGRHLFIKLKCFGVKNKNGKCWTRATAIKSKAAKKPRFTFPIQRVVKAKKGKVIRARVRFQFREELEKRNSITLRSVLRERRKADEKKIKYKKLKLIDRSPD